MRCSADTEIRSLYIDPAASPSAQGGCRVLVVSPLLRELIRAFGALPAEYDEYDEYDEHGAAAGLPQCCSIRWPQRPRSA